MNFLEAFNELNILNEKGPSGQRTYKQFLIYLAEFLGCPIPANYNFDEWVLHHVNCDHTQNNFENLALMNSSHHTSFHRQLAADPNKDAVTFLENGTTKNGEKFEYWYVGKDLLDFINKLMKEPPISEIIKEEV
jgi:hypothetical protein